MVSLLMEDLDGDREDGIMVETEFLRDLWGGDEFKFQIS